MTGGYIEDLTKKRANSSANALLSLIPDKAVKLIGNRVLSISILTTQVACTDEMCPLIKTAVCENMWFSTDNAITIIAIQVNFFHIIV